ncbi:MAG TPA: nucleotidyltransferase domain-containing protein [Verrucomicrobiae bacterium]|nr:nucleotidyltransferase domain-containing protein [Verrucomicrobiae bacterium]
MVKAYKVNALAEILSSGVKAEIFRLLFGVDERELHVREIQRQSGFSVGTVQQELRRLSRLGLIEARRDGNRIYYHAQKQHPLFFDIHNLVLKTTGLVELLRDALAHDDIRMAFVFGSVANSTEKAHSDVDLMVIGSIGLRQLTKLLSGVSGRVGRELNPHIMTVEEFKKRRKTRDHFLTTVLATPRLFVKGNEHELETMGR